MKPFLEEIKARLDALRSDGLHRRLSLPVGVDFSSNDYLGISRHPRLREALIEALRTGPVSSPASRLLNGNTPEHERLENRLARFKGAEAALFFSSGYQANLAVLATLLKSDDLAITDEQNHASIIDGLRLSRCQTAVFPHLDLKDLEAHLRNRPARGRIFIITESLFSMDGDVASLDRYAGLADAHGACLIVDDAHATGVYGDERGSGLVERFGIESRALAVVSTCGKALGIAGAFVTGPSVVVEYLINRARPFIFSTAPPPMILRAVDAALDIAEAEPWRRARVLELASRLRRTLTGHGVDCLRSTGPIVPVVLGKNERAMTVAAEVRKRGFDVQAVRPPAVAPGTARIRVSVHADHTEEEIDGLAGAIVDGLKAADEQQAVKP